MGKDIIMAKGSESKSIFYAKILEIFENSFVYNNGKEVEYINTIDHIRKEYPILYNNYILALEQYL